MSVSTLRHISTEEDLSKWEEQAKIGTARPFAYVTDALFSKIAEEVPVGTLCSDAELDNMNNILGMKAYTKEKTAFLPKVECVGCSRPLNFYDVFLQGVDKHGVDFMRLIASGPKMMLVIPDGDEVQQVRCSGCGVHTPAQREFVTDNAMYCRKC